LVCCAESLLNVFQITLERDQWGIKLLHRPNTGKFTRQPPLLAPQRLIHSANGSGTLISKKKNFQVGG
jgi:hypothetical protein